MSGTYADELDADEHKRIITSLVTPRPIGWISTTGANGVDNLAPFSCYSYANMSPPVVQIRCARRADGELKDTPKNILDTEEFVANLVTEPLIEDMDQTGRSLPPDESEFDEVGIDRAESVTIDAPRVKSARAQMECTLHDHTTIYDSVVIFGEVEYIHLDEDILEDEKVAMEAVDTIGRLGGPYYTKSTALEYERDT